MLQYILFDVVEEDVNGLRKNRIFASFPQEFSVSECMRTEEKLRRQVSRLIPPMKGYVHVMPLTLPIFMTYTLT